MAMDDAQEAADEAGHWYEVPPPMLVRRCLRAHPHAARCNESRAMRSHKVAPAGVTPTRPLSSRPSSSSLRKVGSSIGLHFNDADSPSSTNRAGSSGSRQNLSQASTSRPTSSPPNSLRVAAQVASQLRKPGDRRSSLGEVDLKEPVEAKDLAAEDVAAAADLALLAEVNPLGLGSPRTDPRAAPADTSSAPLEKALKANAQLRKQNEELWAHATDLEIAVARLWKRSGVWSKTDVRQLLNLSLTGASVAREQANRLAAESLVSRRTSMGSKQARAGTVACAQLSNGSNGMIGRRCNRRSRAPPICRTIAATAPRFSPAVTARYGRRPSRREARCAAPWSSWRPRCATRNATVTVV